MPRDRGTATRKTWHMAPKPREDPAEKTRSCLWFLQVENGHQLHSIQGPSLRCCNNFSLIRDSAMKSTSQRKRPAGVSRSAYRTIEGWALGVLIEQQAVTECDHHGHRRDR